MPTDRLAKDSLNVQFARIGKAFASPRRIELLDLLGQGERSVEALAAGTGMSVALTSAHLRVLRGVRLVTTRRDGSWIHYRLADDDVYRMLSSIREVARAQLDEVRLTVATYLTARDRLEPLSRAELIERAQAGDVIVLDVRPRAEFDAGHIPGALSVPLDELEDRLAELPADAEIVAYCRGPYCLYAPTAVGILLDHGRRARRLEEGFPEWRLAGLPVATGAEP
jgi:rhodanese-related sulfurtransferase/DNA-binding transcriptional ArsR family regulator